MDAAIARVAELAKDIQKSFDALTWESNKKLIARETAALNVCSAVATAPVGSYYSALAVPAGSTTSAGRGALQGIDALFDDEGGLFVKTGQDTHTDNYSVPGSTSTMRLHKFSVDQTSSSGGSTITGRLRVAGATRSQVP